MNEPPEKVSGIWYMVLALLALGVVFQVASIVTKGG